MNLKVSQAELASEEERIELQGMEERNLLVREKLAELYNQTRRMAEEEGGGENVGRGSEKRMEL